VKKVSEDSTIGVAATCIDWIEIYYEIQNFKVLKQCKQYADFFSECPLCLKVAINALKAAFQKNEAMSNYIDIMKIKVIFLS